jgi:hypothetical protein
MPDTGFDNHFIVAMVAPLAVGLLREPAARSAPPPRPPTRRVFA